MCTAACAACTASPLFSACTAAAAACAAGDSSISILPPKRPVLAPQPLSAARATDTDSKGVDGARWGGHAWRR